MSTVHVASDPRKAAIRRELATTRDDFHTLARSVGRDGWGQRSQNPGWTNGELLFHMTLAFLLLPRLLPLVRLFGRLPRACSTAFARLLNLATPPFNWANGLAPRLGARLFRGQRLVAKFDRAHAHSIATNWRCRRLACKKNERGFIALTLQQPSRPAASTTVRRAGDSYATLTQFLPELAILESYARGQ